MALTMVCANQITYNPTAKPQIRSLPSVSCAAVCKSEQLLTMLMVSLQSKSSSVGVRVEASAARRPLPPPPLRPPRSVTDLPQVYTVQYLQQSTMLLLQPSQQVLHLTNYCTVICCITSDDLERASTSMTRAWFMHTLLLTTNAKQVRQLS